jgi:hypothetical protein
MIEIVSAVMQSSQTFVFSQTQSWACGFLEGVITLGIVIPLNIVSQTNICDVTSSNCHCLSVPVMQSMHFPYRFCQFVPLSRPPT